MLTNTSPLNAQAAREYLRAIAHLDRARPSEGWEEVVEPLIGVTAQYRTVVDVAYPVTWGWAQSANNALIVLSGVRTAYAGQQLARSWVAGDVGYDTRLFVLQVELWGRAIFQDSRAAGFAQKDTIQIAGHSLGGALASYLAWWFGLTYPESRIQVCTFGQPKVCGPAYRPRDNTGFARYSNAEDNVPSLPPTSDRAPAVYAGLTRAAQARVQAWRHPVGVMVLNPDGTVTQNDTDRPSVMIGATTLLGIINSRVSGFFGTGHSLLTYASLLDARLRTVDAMFAAEVVNNAAAPTAQSMPDVVSPRVVPELVPQVELNRQVAVAREEAAARDAVQLDIPTRYRMKAVRVEGIYCVAWMEKIIAWGPSRKKAQAIARHFDRFLRVYQGVGQSNSNVLVDALIEYLTIAADPSGPLKPTLNDAGTTPAPAGSIVDLSIFGIDLAPMIIP